MNPETQKFDLSPFLPCDEGQEYYDAKASAEAAWNDCPRGDWMIWAAYVLEVDDRLLVRAKALCAGAVRHLMFDRRSRAALSDALLYASGEITHRQMKVCSREARKAYLDVAPASVVPAGVVHAACAAAYVGAHGAEAAYVLDAAAEAAALEAVAALSEAAVLSEAAAEAAAILDAGYAVYCAARSESLLRSADICRDVLTDAVFEKLKLIK
jgi:hypothetical protein